MADSSLHEREERLKKRRDADRRRREAETPEKRRARLECIDKIGKCLRNRAQHD